MEQHINFYKEKSGRIYFMTGISPNIAKTSWGVRGNERYVINRKLRQRYISRKTTLLKKEGDIKVSTSIWKYEVEIFSNLRTVLLHFGLETFGKFFKNLTSNYVTQQKSGD